MIFKYIINIIKYIIIVKYNRKVLNSLDLKTLMLYISSFNFLDFYTNSKSLVTNIISYICRGKRSTLSVAIFLNLDNKVIVFRSYRFCNFFSVHSSRPS